MADLLLRLIAEDAASGAFDSVGGAAKKAGAIFYDFAKDSVKAFAEAERAHKQLARAAGENTAAFEELADTMSRELAVEDETIKRIETLALNYGMLPQQVEAATRATLDYAAATGRDANEAMMQLIRGVEAGNGTLGRMGITFEATGDKALDTARAVQALSQKFGGAAAADADSLAGRTRALDIAMGELKETFGGIFALVEQKTKFIDTFTRSLQSLQQLLTDPATQLLMFGKLIGASDEELVQKALQMGIDKGLSGGGGVKPSGAADPLSDFGVGGITMLSGTGKKGGGGGGGKSDWGWGPFGNPETQFSGWEAEYQEYSQKKLDVLNEMALKEAAQATRRYEKEMEEEEKHDLAMLETHRKVADIELKYMMQQTDRQAAELERRTRMWQRVGQQIGQAVIGGIIDAIAAASSGDKAGSSPWGQGGWGVTLAKTVMGGLFSAFGMGGLWGAGMSAIEGAESGGGAAGFASFGASASNSWNSAAGGRGGIYGPPESHGGGWIQKFHRGGWSMRADEQLALLQTGERVLSRREVGAMGGPAGVESAVRGGGASSLSIYAFDAGSIVDFFGDRGGRGMINAMRANVGPLRLAFGRG